MSYARLYQIIITCVALTLILFSYQNCSPLNSGFKSSNANNFESDISGSPFIDQSKSKTSVESLKQFDRGTEVFIKNCLGCHGSDVETSEKRNLSLKRLNFALSGSIKDMDHLILSNQDRVDVVFSLNFYREKIISELKSKGEMPKDHISVCKPSEIGTSLMRRLNKREYTNTVKSLFGVQFDATKLPNDSKSSSGYDNNGSALFLQDGDGESYFELAEEISRNTIKSGISFTKCSDGTEINARCFNQRIKTLLFYLFRRNISAEEIKRYVSFAAGEMNLQGYRLVLRNALISPHFLFINFNHKNLSNEQTLKLNLFDLATRLSLFLWAETPDRELLDLAKSGALAREATLDDKINRMLANSKSQNFIDNFTEQWLHIDHLGDRPKSSDVAAFKSLAPAMVQETKALFKYVLENNLPITELITADYSFMNNDLAKHYGFSTDGLSDEFKRVSYPDSSRSGLITHASFLSSGHLPGASIIFRGANLMDRILCVNPPSKVDPADVAALEDNKSISEAELVSKHSSDQQCAACHVYIDPLGQGLVGFDEMGKWSGLSTPTANSGNLPDGTKFSGAHELMGLLSERSEFKNCVGKHLAISAVGRDLTEDESCFVREISLASDKNIGLKDYIKKLVKSSVLQSEKTK